MPNHSDKTLILKVPIKPHLKGYLSNFYDIPYKLNQSDDIGIFLYHLLRRRDFKQKEYDGLNLCTAHIEVELPEYMAFNKGCVLMHDYQTYIFNNYLEMHMMRNCMIYLDGRMLHGSKLKQYILDWVDDNNLIMGVGSADWYPLIKQAYYRYRKRKQKKLKKQVNSVSPKNRSNKTTLVSCSVT